MNMLNVKYFTYGPEQVFSNPAPNGSAWFVKELVPVNTPAEELSAVCDIDTRAQAVIDVSQFEAPALAYDSAATVSLSEFRPNNVKYKTQTNADGFVVFSENYYPKGWSARIDGNETDIYRVNYVLRGLSIPSETHTVEFRFEPRPYTIGNRITFASSWLLAVVVVVSIGMAVRQ